MRCHAYIGAELAVHGDVGVARAGAAALSGTGIITSIHWQQLALLRETSFHEPLLRRDKLARRRLTASQPA